MAAAAALSGCAGSPAKLVTATENEVVVSVGKKGTGDVDSALQAAGKVANDACGKFKKTAKYSKTEEVAGGMVARFECVAPPPKS